MYNKCLLRTLASLGKISSGVKKRKSWTDEDFMKKPKNIYQRYVSEQTNRERY